MPDLLPAAEALAEKRCLVTLHNQPDFVLLQPIDARDTLSQEMQLLAAQTTRSFLHVAFPVEAWNMDLSPWDAPPVFGREAFDTAFSCGTKKRLFRCRLVVNF